MKTEPDQFNILFIAPNPSDLESYHRSLKHHNTAFVSESPLVLEQLQTRNWHLVIIGDYLEANPIDYAGELKKIANGDPAFILILKPGHEKLAIKALQHGINDYLFSDEMIPSILHLVINRAIEQKKWQRIYHKVQNNRSQESRDVLVNRSFLETRLTEELKRSQRYQFPVSFLTIKFTDLNHQNANLAPSFESLVLGYYGRLLSKNLRSSDMIGLLDTDRIGIILPHTNKLQAQEAYNRLKNIITSQPYLHHGQNIYFNVSGCVTELSGPITNLSFLDQQDTASSCDESTLTL